MPEEFDWIDRGKRWSAVVLIGAFYYFQPFFYLRAHTNQTARRTTTGVEITKTEYKSFSTFLDGVKLSANYVENSGGRTLTLSKHKFPSEVYVDIENDGIVDKAALSNVNYTRQANEKLFEETITPRFNELKQKLNADQLITEKMRVQPTMDELLR